ncbi:MAG TPA: hypothetical protein IAA98_09060 [Candidatus Avipropionibacterium avicola]|uniref:CHAD domain-containing protein n=1 Tax=Candidatus Avipropionibacterium avicola TaxID=2840701 RepID=A0A9D1KMP7_9ACTN|nr:hypothetical protein [Candidatus Avipropionibacterium avicola]
MSARAGRTRIRVELPFPSLLPPIAHQVLGLRNLAFRAGSARRHVTTVADTADFRLVRAGVVLIHRSDPDGDEWGLAAANWLGLDGERTRASDGTATVPPEWDEILAPLRRHAPLSPVATLQVERQDFQIRGDSGNEMGILSDAKVTIRRGGVITARFREITVRAGKKSLNPDQLAWIEQTLVEAGGTSVTVFPSLARRLGAPATNETDFPDPERMSSGWFDQFVAREIATALRQVVVSTDPQPVADLSRRIGLLEPALDPQWAAGLRSTLDSYVDSGQDQTRRLGLIDLLVADVRAPQILDSWPTDSDAAIERLRGLALTRVEQAVGGLTTDAPEQAWQDAAAAIGPAEELVVTFARGGRDRKRAKKLRKLGRRLADCVDSDGERLRAQVTTATVDEAFALGREFERVHADVERRRERLLEELDDVMDEVRS